MNISSVKQILFLTRPWQVLFHIELAKSLLNELGCVPVRFVTFFLWAREKVEEAGYECVYMPEELGKVTGNEMTDERFSEIDRVLYESQGANFNLMLQSERFLPKDCNEAALFGRKHLVILDRLVSEGTVSISSMYDHFFYWLCGALANSRGGGHFAFVGCGLPPGRVIALRTPWETWHVPFYGDAEALLEECRKLLHTPVEKRIEYMNPLTLPPLSKRFRVRYNELKCSERDRAAGSYFPELRILSLQTIKNRFPQKWFRYPEPEYEINCCESLKNVEASFCYLPLHMEPEATILMYSPWLRDQIEMCRLVSQALPVGWKLLVKENPKMRGLRKPDYYRILKSIPNLILVSPKVDSTTLILAASVVVTLAGTASNESSILSKPSISLGRPPGLNSFTIAGDISSSLRLADFFEILQEIDYTLDINKWIAWLEGSFPGREVPVFNKQGFLSTPFDAMNIEAYSSYILRAIKHNYSTI